LIVASVLEAAAMSRAVLNSVAAALGMHPEAAT